MERLKNFVEVLDQYDALIGGAPQELRSDLRRLYQLPADADMIREEVDYMGTHDLDVHLQNIYNNWSNNNTDNVPDHYARLLNDRQHMINMVDRIDDIMNRIAVRIDIHQRAFRPTSRANTFINTREPDFAFDQENMPP